MEEVGGRIPAGGDWLAGGRASPEKEAKRRKPGLVLGLGGQGQFQFRIH